MSSTDFVNSGSYFRTVFVLISGITTLTAFTGGATGFLISGFTVTGLVFFTGFAVAALLATAFLAAGLAAFLGCTFLTALTGFFLIAIWLGFFCDKHC